MASDKIILYNPIWIDLWICSIPFWRRFLARHFEKYKMTEKDYEKWLFDRFVS